MRGLVELTDTFEPVPEAVATYQPMYAEFKQFYNRLHDSYARLNGKDHA